MRGKLVKLALGLSMLALATGVAQKPAAAAVPWCPAYKCCDAQCALIRSCGLVGGSCVCNTLCRPGGPGEGSD